jgi:hypothetical protein
VAIPDGGPARCIDGQENFRAWMQELADRAISHLHGDLTRQAAQDLCRCRSLPMPRAGDRRVRPNPAAMALPSSKKA